MTVSSRPSSVLVLHAIISPYKIELFNHLATQLPNLHVIYFATNESRRLWVVDSSQITHSYEVICPGFIETMPKLLFVFRLVRALFRRRPSLVVLAEYSHLGYWVGLVVAMIIRAKRVMINESTWQDRPRGPLKEWVKRRFVKGLDGAVAQSSASKSYLETLGMPASRICVKGYSTNNVFYSERAAQARADRPGLIQRFDGFKHNVLFVGRFSPEKNLLSLLAAWQKVQTIASDWGLILLGDGPQEASLRALIRSEKLRVRIIPFLQKHEVPAVYSIADLFVLPSLSEPWGLVVNEAMACGVPVVVSDRAGCVGDLVTHDQTGWVINPESVDDLVSALQALISNHHLRQRLATAGAEAVSYFSSDRSAQRMANFLKEMLR